MPRQFLASLTVPKLRCRHLKDQPVRSAGRAGWSTAKRGLVVLAVVLLAGGPQPWTGVEHEAARLLAAQAPRRGERGVNRRAPRDGAPRAPRGAEGSERRARPIAVETFLTDVPEHPYDIVLGNPTDRSVTASVLGYAPVEGYLEFGVRQDEYVAASDRITLEPGEPVEVVLDGLVAHTQYYYRWRSRSGPAEAFDASDEFTFRTGRTQGDSFVFTVQSDPHLDGRTDPRLYEASLRNALEAGPDFHIDLGDTFMTGKRRQNFRDALPQYLAQRYYFGLIGTSAPVFLVSGNHDAEARDLGAMAAWARAQRQAYFGTPSDAFADRGNYYQWQWGDALFVALDPFWATRRARPRRDYWSRTLGAAQYRWLRETLEASRAKFKFVFIHHLVGGINQAARGGAAAAALFEWGGRGLEGDFEFDEKRPGWGKPIHELLVETGVTVVFHGHDHVFAKEELDGVAYQLVPQPGLDRYGAPREVDGNYSGADIVGGPGHVRVTVSPDAALVEMVQSRREGSVSGNGRVAYSYRAEPKSMEERQ